MAGKLTFSGVWLQASRFAALRRAQCSVCDSGVAGRKVRFDVIALLVRRSMQLQTRVRSWHKIPVLTGAEKGLVSGVFQTFSIKESGIGGTSDVLVPGSKRGKMTLGVL